MFFQKKKFIFIFIRSYHFFVWTTSIQSSWLTYNKLLGFRSVDLGFSFVDCSKMIGFSAVSRDALKETVTFVDQISNKLTAETTLEFPQNLTRESANS